MSDSANVYSLPGADSVHICHVNKTETNLRTELEECQVAIETDTKKLAFKDQSDGYHTCVCEDTNGKVAIGNGTTAARSELDLYGALYQTKTITSAHTAIREAVGPLVASAGSDAEAHEPPIRIINNIVMPAGCDLAIIPSANITASGGFVGRLTIFGTADTGGETPNFVASYRGDFNLYWVYDINTGAQQYIEALHNYNSAIGLYDGDTDFDIIVEANPYTGATPAVRLKNATAYPVTVFYSFVGAAQP